MSKRVKISILFVFAVLMLRVCLSNDKKKEQELIRIPDVSVPVSITPDISSPHPVNPGIFGINIGFAFKRELDKDSGFVQLLRDLHPYSLRFPGGTVANYYHPGLPVYGYKLGEIPSGLGTLYMEQSRRKENILYNFIRLCKLTGAKAVFCANVYTGTIDETLFVISELKKNQVDIAGVELGNEFCLMEYRKQFPDASVYIKKVKACAQAIRAKYPELRIAIVGGDGVPDKDMSARSKFMRAWNQVMAKENFYDAYTWHPYQDCPECDREAYLDRLFTSNLQSLAPQRTKYLYRLGMNFVPIFGQQRKLWLTEWNVGNLAYLDRTFLQAAYVSEYFLTLLELNSQFNNYFELTNLHAIDGIITTEKGKLDPLLSNGMNNATTQYFAFKFIASTLSKDAFIASQKISCADTSVFNNFVCKTFLNKKENKTYLHFVNHSGKKIQLNVNAKTTSGIQVVSLDADYPYAAAGKTSYEKDYPNKLKPVRYRNEALKGTSVSIAPYSFGYIAYAN